MWRVAFEAAGRWRPIILQHLLLGMNAHINLDLGVTASELGEGGSIDAVRADFDAINDVLGELVDGCQGALGQVSPWLDLADRVGGSRDEEIIRFSLVAARRQAWSVAERLAPLRGAERERAIVAVDARAVKVARAVEHPGIAGSAALLLVRLRERAAPGRRDAAARRRAARRVVKPCRSRRPASTNMAAVTKRSTEQLLAGLDHVRAAPIGQGRLEMIVRRPALDEREVLEVGELDLDVGLVGDTWRHRRSTRTADGSPHPHMQVTLMNARAVALLAGSRANWPLAGDQLYVDLHLGVRSCRRGRSCRSAAPSSRSPTSPTAAVPSSPAASASTPCASSTPTPGCASTCAASTPRSCNPAGSPSATP